MMSQSECPFCERSMTSSHTEGCPNRPAGETTFVPLVLEQLSEAETQYRLLLRVARAAKAFRDEGLFLTGDSCDPFHDELREALKAVDPFI